MLFKVTQILIPIIAVSILPWGVWLTNTTYEQRERIAKIESWISIGPRFTPNDGENLRLRVLKEMEEKNETSSSRISIRLDALTLAINELKLELTRHTASSDPKRAQ